MLRNLTKQNEKKTKRPQEDIRVSVEPLILRNHPGMCVAEASNLSEALNL